ncbi:MAG: M48 family metallopeptidase [Verrucomicrobiales bacterium]|nr:M48 family metallopeptidase [Verrucomicrobiales bacterium]
MSLPGTRSTETVKDDGQTDFLGMLWNVVSGSVAPAAGRDTLAVDELQLPAGRLSIRYVRHLRARRYRLLFRRDGTARCTVPRRGTLREARRFVSANEPWLSKRLQIHRAAPTLDSGLRVGGTVRVGGEELRLERDAEGVVRFGVFEVKASEPAADLRPHVERVLRKHAVSALPQRVRELATLHGLDAKISAVSVRNQRTRWGSCSARGRISLNWRLVQVPPSVRDYVILHELAHLVHLNHSARFWTLVESLCPGYREEEAWLKRSGRSVL